MVLPEKFPEFRTITKITETKRGRMALFFDDEFDFSVDLATFTLGKIQVGKKYTEEEYNQLRHTTQFEAGKAKALHLISHKSYTCKMLRERLIQDFEPDSVDDVVKRMEELGLVNDSDYANRFSRDLVYIKKYAPFRVRQELRQRGIDDSLIEDALEQFEEISTESQIAKIIIKKYASSLITEKGQRRAINALVRMGYRYEDINPVMRNLLEDCDYYSNLD